MRGEPGSAAGPVGGKGNPLETSSGREGGWMRVCVCDDGDEDDDSVAWPGHATAARFSLGRGAMLGGERRWWFRIKDGSGTSWCHD